MLMMPVIEERAENETRSLSLSLSRSSDPTGGKSSAMDAWLVTFSSSSSSSSLRTSAGKKCELRDAYRQAHANKCLIKQSVPAAAAGAY